MTVVDDIKAKLDVADLISGYVSLQKSGASFKGLCPFHTEKTPSFFVFPNRQSWRCFGACATGGDVFSFYMQRENVDFRQALQDLARMTGTEIPSKQRRKSEDPLFKLTESASRFFTRNLASSQGVEARAYVEGRGITSETVAKFQLGLSPNDGSALRSHLLSLGYTESQLSLAGLVSQPQEGAGQDLFRRRLIFPIWDSEGRMVGFGGRALDDVMPKYLNSRQGPIFDKSKILFGFHLAKDSIKSTGSAVVVEGYMDAIMAHQNGFGNVVASMGTALTSYQTDLLRSTKEVVMALDPDDAGQEATLRSMETSWKVMQRQEVSRSQRGSVYRRPSGPTLKIAPLPAGRDPDDIIREDPAQWERLTTETLPVFEFLLKVYARRFDLSTAQGKSDMAGAVSHLVYAEDDPFEQDRHFRTLAELLRVPESTLKARMDRPRPQRAPQRLRRTDAAAATPFQRLEHDALEEQCLALLLQNPEMADMANGLRSEMFQRVENRELFTNWLQGITIELLDQGIRSHLDYLSGKPLPPADPKEKEADLSQCIHRLQERRLRQLKTEEGLRLSDVNPEEFSQFEEEILKINSDMEALFRARSV